VDKSRLVVEDCRFNQIYDLHYDNNSFG